MIPFGKWWNIWNAFSDHPSSGFLIWCWIFSGNSWCAERWLTPHGVWGWCCRVEQEMLFLYWQLPVHTELTGGVFIIRDGWDRCEIDALCDSVHEWLHFYSICWKRKNSLGLTGKVSHRRDDSRWYHSYEYYSPVQAGSGSLKWKQKQKQKCNPIDCNKKTNMGSRARGRIAWRVISLQKVFCLGSSCCWNGFLCITTTKRARKESWIFRRMRSPCLI